MSDTHLKVTRSFYCKNESQTNHNKEGERCTGAMSRSHRLWKLETRVETRSRTISLVALQSRPSYGGSITTRPSCIKKVGYDVPNHLIAWPSELV